MACYQGGETRCIVLYMAMYSTMQCIQLVYQCTQAVCTASCAQPLHATLVHNLCAHTHNLVHNSCAQGCVHNLCTTSAQPSCTQHTVNPLVLTVFHRVPLTLSAHTTHTAHTTCAQVLRSSEKFTELLRTSQDLCTTCVNTGAHCMHRNPLVSPCFLEDTVHTLCTHHSHCSHKVLRSSEKF